MFVVAVEKDEVVSWEVLAVSLEALVSHEAVSCFQPVLLSLFFGVAC